MAVETERTRRSKAPEERRRDLLDAAVSVFTEKGLQRTTISDITQAAGVAKGTFYLYYSSKEHLLGALKERFVDQMIGRAQSLFGRVGVEDWWDLVDATTVASVDFLLEHRELVQVFAQESLSPETDSVFAECATKLQHMFEMGIRAGAEAGAFEAPDAAVVASFLQHGIHGTVVDAILYEKVDRDRLVESLSALARKTLRPAG